MAHACDATIPADVGRNTFERHNCNSASIFRYGCLVWVNDVHDDATLLHAGEAALE
jgi:hypothetical protein